MQKATEFLFVYGTLRPGGSVRECPVVLREHVAQATIAGNLYDLGPFPGVVLPGAEANRVVGDIFAVDADTLRRADTYEGCDPENEADSWYVRRRVSACLDDGTPLTCWVYEVRLARFPNPTRIPSGDWIEHCETKAGWADEPWPLSRTV